MFPVLTNPRGSRNAIFSEPSTRYACRASAREFPVNFPAPLTEAEALAELSTVVAPLVWACEATVEGLVLTATAVGLENKPLQSVGLVAAGAGVDCAAGAGVSSVFPLTSFAEVSALAFVITGAAASASAEGFAPEPGGLISLGLVLGRMGITGMAGMVGLVAGLTDLLGVAVVAVDERDA